MKSRLLLSVAMIPLVIMVLRGGDGGQDVIVQLKEGHSGRELDDDYGDKKSDDLANKGIYVIHIADSAREQTVLRALQKDPVVENAETDRRVKLSWARLANVSPGLVQDMIAHLDGQTMTSFNGATVLKAYAEQPAMKVIGADQVRNSSTGAGTRVAYIDTGVDPMHPALRPWLDPGADVLNDRSASELSGLSQDMLSLLDQDMMSLLDQDMMSLLDHKLIFLLNQSPASILNSAARSSVFPPAFGHGTLVAGAIHVVAPDARIVPIKAFNGYGYTTMFSLIESVYKAIDLDVDVLNMSFSTTENSNIFRKALEKARDEGIALVASAGNDARDGKDLYPATYKGVYSVAATDLNDRLASFSNYGTGVSVTAPGAYVISTLPGGKYAAAWGTSFSAPVVSGAMAMLASSRGHGKSNPTLVINTADSIDVLNPGYEKKLGRGRINVSQALKRR
ncbi:MAG TPA: S8 family serine peptidase [Terriglobia bacterium]|nr:S8 family serine peptidase [Terriglobia bacterium]